MGRRDALILRVTAGWTVFVWLFFVKNIVGDDDHSTGFKVVHVLIATVSIALAVAVWGVATRSRRQAKARR